MEHEVNHRITARRTSTVKRPSKLGMKCLTNGVQLFFGFGEIRSPCSCGWFEFFEYGWRYAPVVALRSTYWKSVAVTEFERISIDGTIGNRDPNAVDANHLGWNRDMRAIARQEHAQIRTRQFDQEARLGVVARRRASGAR